MNIIDQDDIDNQISNLDYNESDFRIKYSKILNFIHYNIDIISIKSALILYAEKLDRSDAIKSIPANLIGIEGKIAYCLNRNAKLDQLSLDKITRYLDSSQSVITAEIPDWEELPYNHKNKDILTYVDCFSRIDNSKTRVLNNKLSIRELPTTVRKIISDSAKNKSVIIKKLLEHYKQSLSEAKADNLVKDWIKPLTIIVDTINILSVSGNSIKSSARGAKSRKMKSTFNQIDRKGEKAALTISFKDEDLNLGLTSIDPTNLVGSNAAVIFNTKNNHCDVYLAKTGQTLSFKGSKIINFDETSSFGRTLKNPKNDLPHWSRASTIKRLEVLLTGINGKRWELTGKLNKNSMIIKIL